MRTRVTVLALLLALPCPGLAADPPVLVVIPPKAGTAVPQDGKVPAVTWTVEWLLRDDKTASLGDLATHRTFASAQAVAAKKLADRGEPGTYWYIKSVVIKAEAELVDPDDLPAAQKRLWKAIQVGVDKKAEACNFLVRDIAAAKVKGVGDKTADKLWAYFNTAAAKDGWVEVKGEKAKGTLPAVSAIEKANRLAEEGQLVIGVISSELLNKYKPEGRIKAYEEGHVFVVTPTGGTDWKTTLAANAVYDPKTPIGATYTPASKVIASNQWEAVQFFAIPLPAE